MDGRGRLDGGVVMSPPRTRLTPEPEFFHVSAHLNSKFTFNEISIGNHYNTIHVNVDFNN